MGVMQRVVKPRNKKSKRALESREPKALENDKLTLFVRGPKISQHLLNAMKDLHTLKKPYVAPEFYNKKNEIRPFEDHTKLEFFSRKNDSSLFVYGNHNKKRPHNMVMGRMHDGHLLDMVEFGVENYKALMEFQNEKVTLGTKPCLLFSGSKFESDPDMKRVKNLLVDMFRGGKATNVRLAGLEHCLQFTASEGDSGRTRIHLRSYRINMMRSSDPKLPRVELEEMGPRMDLVLRRSHLASEDLFRASCKQLKHLHKAKKIKNISEDGLGTVLGRVHIPAQEINTIQTRKMKGLRDTPEEKKLKEFESEKSKAAAKWKSDVEAVFG